MKKTSAQIVDILTAASNAYYETSDTMMTDQEFDSLVDELRQIDQSNPWFKKIGVTPTGTKVKHKIKMGSQEKLATKEDFMRWAQKVVLLSKKHLAAGVPVFVVQHKVDGCSVAVNYNNNILESVVSRGDGEYGEDITTNGRHFNTVDVRLHNFQVGHVGGSFSGSLRGEAVLLNNVFARDIKKLGYKNPRNSVSGISRDQKSSELASLIEVVFYDFYNPAFGDYETEQEKLAALSKLTNASRIVPSSFFNTPEEVWEDFQKTDNSRSEIPYDIDGIVVRANSLAVQEEMGESSDGRPQGQRCIKCSQMGYETTLNGITLTIGSQGQIVPTAQLEPVEIDGTTVSNALLNNFEEIVELGLAIGDKVMVKKMGGIIPKVIKVTNRRVTRDRIPITAPKTCHCCSTELVKDGVHVFCRNEDCDGSQIRRLNKWVQKREIKWLGEELIQELYDNHGIQEIPDIYGLTQSTLENVRRGIGIVGNGATQIMAEIEKSKTCSVSDLLGSLSIPLLGQRMCEIIVTQSNGKISTIEDFLSLSASDLLKLQGFQETKANTIVDGIQKKKSLILTMKDIITVPVVVEKAVVAGGSLSGMSFCFTGAINKVDTAGKRFTRSMMWELVEANGGTVLEDVKACVNGFLVQADPSSESSKTKKAQKVGVKIISEEKFFEMI